MEEKLREHEAARENEIIQLYKKMANENLMREREIEELRERMKREQQEMKEKVREFTFCPRATVLLFARRVELLPIDLFQRGEGVRGIG